MCSLFWPRLYSSSNWRVSCCKTGCLARTVNTLIRTRVKRWHFLQGARRALWTQITAIKSSGMDTNWDSTLQKLSIPPFLWKPGMGKQRSTGQAPSSPAFKIGPEGYVFYIVLHLDVACPKFCIFKNLKEMINFWIYGTGRKEFDFPAKNIYF